jgi:hypothetical protein
MPLARALRGHDGLSSLARTYDDYLGVMRRAIAAAAPLVALEDRNIALAIAYRRAARGMIHQGRWSEAWRLARAAWTHDRARRGEVLALLPMAIKRALAGLLGRHRRD